MPIRAVFLVGFMGSGKNTVGRELAGRLGWQFIDMDREIEAREGQSIPDIFRNKGEATFRQAENAALRDFLESSPGRDCVVALGGGAFAQENNRRLLHDWPTIFLDAPVEELWQRCQQDDVERPLRKNLEGFTRLYGERLTFYRQASLRVETSGKKLLSICSEIENALRLRGAPKKLEAGEFK
ncbi:MAG TPA: shikimate kinase [Terriglobales bacterium]|nr:shikimate kinase [Terriglobales bacterium]